MVNIHQENLREGQIVLYYWYYYHSLLTGERERDGCRDVMCRWARQSLPTVVTINTRSEGTIREGA